MKASRYFLTLLASTSALVAANAYADSNDRWAHSNLYGAISGDVTWLNDYDTGGGGNAAIGYRIWPSDFGDFRIEAEAGYHAMEKSGYYTYMGNLYYDFNSMRSNLGTGWNFVPYVGAGLGDATVHLGEYNSGGRYNEHGDVFAYQFMAGLTIVPPDMPNNEWSIGYRYVGSNNVDGRDNFGVTRSNDLESNNIEIAYRMHF